MQEEQENDSSFTCEICIEPDSSAQKFKNHNSKCSHNSYCSDCIAKYIEFPVLDCEELLEPLKCNSILPQKLLIRWCNVLCESTVSEYERVHCPFQDCSTLILNECGEKR
ncbi:RBR-type E3 ubiquitin transferase [Ranunculus cassubicifolius]